MHRQVQRQAAVPCDSVDGCDPPACSEGVDHLGVAAFGRKVHGRLMLKVDQLRVRPQGEKESHAVSLAVQCRIVQWRALEGLVSGVDRRAGRNERFGRVQLAGSACTAQLATAAAPSEEEQLSAEGELL